MARLARRRHRCLRPAADSDRAGRCRLAGRWASDLRYARRNLSRLRRSPGWNSDRLGFPHTGVAQRQLRKLVRAAPRRQWSASRRVAGLRVPHFLSLRRPARLLLRRGQSGRNVFRLAGRSAASYFQLLRVFGQLLRLRTRNGIHLRFRACSLSARCRLSRSLLHRLHPAGRQRGDLLGRYLRQVDAIRRSVPTLVDAERRLHLRAARARRPQPLQRAELLSGLAAQGDRKRGHVVACVQRDRCLRLQWAVRSGERAAHSRRRRRVLRGLDRSASRRCRPLRDVAPLRRSARCGLGK